ncbi:hypothetical protein J8TS2_04240 [Lederbergia ruris]|uniref:AlpA family phage regulatory protein n=1 Tax=Lederbergia ruris TaxID=217495 RepID=A0ABQ4KDQ8_9BACI|nr:hypothetical protein [Lederbergia ruris]GIN56105.1 hypothetical protein J8TS2_04240 [Lederbergia ruris]
MEGKKVYLSQTEIGNITEKMGWGDRRKVAVLIGRGQFPEHDARIGKTRGWRHETIERWIKDVVEKDLQSRRK